MDVKGILLAGVFAASMLAASRAEAQFYKPLRCDSCATSDQFRGRAISAGQGHHLVYSLTNNRIEYWHVTSGGSGPGGPPGTPMNVEGATAAVASSTALERIPPVEAVNELNKAHTLHAIGGDLRPMFNVPVHMLGLPASHRTKTAYEFVKDYNMRSMVSSAVGDAGVISQVTSSNLIGALQDLKSLVTSYLGLRDQAGLIFKVVFTDGSYVQFTVDIDSPLGTYIEDSARTAAGQAIPSSIDDVRGTWTNGGGDNLGPMADHFGRLGATMTFVGAAGGAITSIVCSGVGAEKVCRVTRVIY